MTTEAYRETFRERLSEGQTVYTPFTPLGSFQLRSVDLTRIRLGKATVNSTKGKRYPGVIYWGNPTQDPKGFGLSIALSPREVFTDLEVREILGLEPQANVDELLLDDVKSFKAAMQLLTVVVERMGDDLDRNDLDPEY